MDIHKKEAEGAVVLADTYLNRNRVGIYEDIAGALAWTDKFENIIKIALREYARS